MPITDYRTKEEYDKQFCEDNKENQRLYQKQYREENKEELKQYDKQYYQDHKKYKKQYYQDHKENYKQNHIKIECDFCNKLLFKSSMYRHIKTCKSKE